MRKKRTFRIRSDDDSLIDLTPLIDVVFVVLIAFILVAPLLEVDHVDLAPSSVNSEKEISNKSSLAVYVRKDNSIWLNKQCVTLDELLFQLRQRRKLFANEVPQLFHDSEAHFGMYQKVKNAFEVAGFEKMDVILQGQGK